MNFEIDSNDVWQVEVDGVDMPILSAVAKLKYHNNRLKHENKLLDCSLDEAKTSAIYWQNCFHGLRRALEQLLS